MHQNLHWFCDHRTFQSDLNEKIGTIFGWRQSCPVAANKSMELCMSPNIAHKFVKRERGTLFKYLHLMNFSHHMTKRADGFFC